MSTAPDFSAFAEVYARGRPRYPAALYSWLAAQVERAELAWDCGTGNGQAALDLAEHFRRVVATDVSAEQLRHAPPHPRVEYRLAPAESSGLAAASVDLVGAAAALHWFDVAAFAAEARRVARPGGLLAVWSYHPARVAPPFDELFHRFYWDLLKPWFPPQSRHVDSGYAALELPGEPLAVPSFEVSVEWDLAELRAFVVTWTGGHAYQRDRGEHPLQLVAAELAELWGDPARRHTLRWRLDLRAQRL